MEINISLIVALIISLSQILKNFGLDKRYIPIFNIGVGMFIGSFYLTDNIKVNLMYGLICGLTASGLFDLTKFLKK
jgi:hypothetical protein